MEKSKLSVLIIEDNPVHVAQFVGIMNNFTNDISVSTTAERGLLIFKGSIETGNPYNVLLTDINLPGLSGKELIKEIFEIDEKHSEFRVNIIAMSADPPRKHLIEALNKGAGCYLEKPITNDMLIGAFKSLNVFK